MFTLILDEFKNMYLDKLSPDVQEVDSKLNADMSNEIVILTSEFNKKLKKMKRVEVDRLPSNVEFIKEKYDEFNSKVDDKLIRAFGEFKTKLIIIFN